MTAPLIGLIGRARSGKDTFASVLVEEQGFRRMSFADPLREAALRLNPWVGPCPLPSWSMPEMHRLADVIVEIGWEAAKDHAPGVRETLQRLGTDVVRELDPNLWVNAAMTAYHPGAPTVFTDVRFLNEANAIRERGGLLIRIERGSAGPATMLHASETALDEFWEDVTVVNDDTLEELQQTAREWQSYGGRGLGLAVTIPTTLEVE